MKTPSKLVAETSVNQKTFETNYSYLAGPNKIVERTHCLFNRRLRVKSNKTQHGCF